MNDTVEVPLSAVRFGLSPRATRYDPEHVASLVEVLDEVPPIVVHASTMRVVDGVHRVMAAQRAGRTVIRAVMFEGDETEVRIEAVRRNIAHGKPLSLAEREAAAVAIIEGVPGWSDRRIAGVTGLSPKTVGRLRARATVDSPQLRARLGRDGKLRPVDPAEVRKRVAEALRSDPSASNRAIARRAGASQATVRDVRDRLQRGMSEVASLEERRRRRQRPPSATPQHQRAPRRPDVVLDEFVDWFDARHIDDTDWRQFVDTIPIGRVYEVADIARQRSESWRTFAAALEDRARGHRRSNG
jgi:ParB-like chromosome segregation protein Spo0J